MSFGQAIATCFSKYVTFSGRARRPEYWWFALFVVLVAIVAAIVDGVVFGPGTVEDPAPQVFQPLWSLATFLPMLAAGWRRMHDTGRPGWYLLIPVLVSIATFIGLFLGILGFSGLERAGVDEDALRSAAGGIGVAGLAIAGIAQLIVAILVIWWLTRPTEPQDNQYGPVPA